ncbi:Cys-tRNA(Pro) deacylase [Paenibacillus sp. MMS20-IR301]|uniref:Cys-tRNA(Pro) deacylase n=1 Tax=Paenibacillus sp. MMS20-IR301 TaxID=2895946 RepID=UPI0028E38477|nr:Cys-tRNA(Pro) deacylase [Paenibacillus sp. MMS20-IR301]WNS44892.1 Cys-tRNA(Pro) deacylase [Paenibacillus sp. MMS20-IR301]
MQVNKTNAMRILDARKTRYAIHTYDNEDGLIHGSAVAEKIGLPAETVFKTLVAHSGPQAYVFVIPVAEELDLKKAARAAGAKKIEMLPLKELLQWTGYVRGGCSPVGMKKQYPTFIHSSGEFIPAIAVSAGRIGMQMELEPKLLAGVVEAVFTDLIKE